MKINTLNKTLLAAFMAVTLAACTNTNTPQSSVAASTSSEVVEQSSDIIDESIKEDSEKNKPADEEISVEKEKNSSEDNKEEKKDNDTTIDVEKKADEKSSPAKNTQSKEKEASTLAKEETSTKEDINYQEREGTYISNLIASKNGDRDPQMGLTSLANLSISDNTLALEGTIDYLKNPDSYDNSEEYDKATYNFKITPDTKFQAVGGMADPEIFTKEEFVEYYQGVKDSGLALKIDVKDGVATIVSIAS